MSSAEATKTGEPPRRKNRKWEESYAALVAYKEKHGTTRVPRRYPDDAALAKWVGVQRTYERKLSSEKRKKLLDIGFDFSVGNASVHWDQMFVKLKEFQRQEGNCLVPQAHPELGEWVHAQRQRYQRKILPKDREEKLESIGFVWSVRSNKPRSTSTDDERWQSTYLQLVHHLKQYGHLKVEYNHDKKLKNWIGNQRQLFRSNQLRKDRKELLESLGLDLDPGGADFQAAWDQRYHEYTCHLNQKEGTKVDSKGVGPWINCQREILRNGDMEPARAERLFNTGFSPPPEANLSWQARYQKLKGLGTHEALRKVPDLKRWLGLQNILMKHEKLSKERKDLLNALGLLQDADKGDSERATDEQQGESESSQPPNEMVLGANDYPAKKARLNSRLTNLRVLPNSTRNAEQHGKG